MGEIFSIVKYEKNEIIGRGTVISVQEYDQSFEKIEVGSKVKLDIGLFEVVDIERNRSMLGVKKSMNLLVKPATNAQKVVFELAEEKKIKEGIIIESSKVLRKYEGKPNIKEVLVLIQKELQEVLQGFLKDNLVYPHHFPIEFENELGKWKIYEDGTTYFERKKPVEYINVNITITPTGEIKYKDEQGEN